MSAANYTPNLIATENILPFSCIRATVGVNFGVKPNETTAAPVLGVTDGSVSQFDATYHSTEGQPCSLQLGRFVLLRASGTIAQGDLLYPTTSGAVVAWNGETLFINMSFVSMQAASNGEIFWASRIGGYYTLFND